MKELKQCVAVKDMEIGKRDKILNALKQKERIRENVIRELKAEVNKLSEGRSLQNVNKNTCCRTGTGGRRDHVVSAAPGSMEEIFVRPYAKYFSLEFKSETTKRDMCPYRRKADISEQMGGKPKTITSKGSSAVLVEVASVQQSRRIREVKTVLERECEVREHALYNGRKGLVYINNNDLTDMESFRKGPMEVYPIIDIQKATWIKPRRATTHAVII